MKSPESAIIIILSLSPTPRGRERDKKQRMQDKHTNARHLEKSWHRRHGVCFDISFYSAFNVFVRNYTSYILVLLEFLFSKNNMMFGGQGFKNIKMNHYRKGLRKSETLYGSKYIYRFLLLKLVSLMLNVCL